MFFLWAIRCAWCADWFFMCPDCYRGHKYCGDDCRHDARLEQCERARPKHRQKKTIAALELRAAATAAWRDRVRRGLPSLRSRFARCDGSRSRPGPGSMLGSPPRTARCQRCGRRGLVRVRPP